ncbi:MAG: SDR family NAD(P)-dependent oxidoreductase [Aliidongia sp.]
MSGTLAGKRALVTAAAQGIGAATARALAESGVDVMATDINESGLAWAREQRPGDPADSTSAIRRAITLLAEELGAVDILVNAAGFVHHGTVLDCNRGGLGFCLRSQCEEYVSDDPRHPAGDAGGRTGSRSSTLPPWCPSVKGAPNRFAYGASKAAVIGLTKAVAADHIRQGIRCQRDLPGHDPDAVA